MKTPRVFTLLQDISDCLCETIKAEGLAEPCFCGVLPGSQIAADFFPSCLGEDGDGMAWVRLANAYPAFSPGVPLENPAESPVAGLGYEIEVGILRSIPGDQEGITEEDATSAVEQQMTDMLVIRKAIQCCVALERGDYILGQYLPVGPQGLVVGGAFTVMVHQP